jgi:hypothetical protein
VSAIPSNIGRRPNRSEASPAGGVCDRHQRRPGRQPQGRCLAHRPGHHQKGGDISDPDIIRNRPQGRNRETTQDPGPFRPERTRQGTVVEPPMGFAIGKFGSRSCPPGQSRWPPPATPNRNGKRWPH